MNRRIFCLPNKSLDPKYDPQNLFLDAYVYSK